MLEGPTEPRGHLRKGSKAPTPLAALTRPLAKTTFSQAAWEMVGERNSQEPENLPLFAPQPCVLSCGCSCDHSLYMKGVYI